MAVTLIVTLASGSQAASRSIHRGGKCIWTHNKRKLQVRWDDDGMIVARVRTIGKDWSRLMALQVGELNTLAEFSISLFEYKAVLRPRSRKTLSG